MRVFKRLSLIVLAGFYIFAGVTHFAKPENFLAIIPPELPAPLALVLISGAAEIALGVLVLFRRTRRWAALGIIALLIAVFPANLYMYRHAVETDGAAYGIPVAVLYVRLWFQLVLIGWAAIYARRERFNAYPL